MIKEKKPKNRKPVDALKLLKKDHRMVEESFKEYEALGSKAYKKKKRLADSICTELTIHAKIEEEIFYPTFRKSSKDAKSLVNEATVEHNSVKDLIQQIRAMDSEEELFDAKVKVLAEYVGHHVKEEEEEIFKAIKKTDIDLMELGQQLLSRQQELR